MSPRKRRRLTPTEDWQQLELLCQFADQRRYELVRPVVLFGQPPAERARQTGVPERTISRTASLFEAAGLPGLAPALPKRRGRPPATDLRTAIAALKAEYPAFKPYQIGTICYVRFGRRPSAATIARALAETPPAPTARRFPSYLEIPEARQRRLAVIRLHAEGWTPSCIAGYLQVSRETVYAVLRRWREECFAGLADWVGGQAAHAPPSGAQGGPPGDRRGPAAPGESRIGRVPDACRSPATGHRTQPAHLRPDSGGQSSPLRLGRTRPARARAPC